MEDLNKLHIPLLECIRSEYIEPKGIPHSVINSENDMYEHKYISFDYIINSITPEIDTRSPTPIIDDDVMDDVVDVKYCIELNRLDELKNKDDVYEKFNAMMHELPNLDVAESFAICMAGIDEFVEFCIDNQYRDFRYYKYSNMNKKNDVDTKLIDHKLVNEFKVSFTEYYLKYYSIITALISIVQLDD